MDATVNGGRFPFEENAHEDNVISLADVKAARQQTNVPLAVVAEVLGTSAVEDDETSADLLCNDGVCVLKWKPMRPSTAA